MVRNISQIVSQLFQKETLEEVSENELRYFVRQYPYAGTGHLLLAKKLQMEGEKRAFEREIAVTSIYFNNPAWLQFILQEPNGNASPDSQQTLSIFHASENEQFIDPEDNLVDVSPDEVKSAAIKYEDAVEEPQKQNSSSNGNEQTDIPGDEIQGDIEEEIRDEAGIKPSIAEEAVAEEAVAEEAVAKEGVSEETVAEKPVPAEAQPEGTDKEETSREETKKQEATGTSTEEEIEESKEEPDDSTHHSKSDLGSVPEPEAAVIETLVPPADKLFYDDGEVFAEFITEEANEEIRLNEETLNAPWETEEEDAGDNSSADEAEPVSDDELRKNFEKRKHLTSEVVAGELERPEPYHKEAEMPDSDHAGPEAGFSDDQMVDRPDLISFESQKASQRDPLPVEITNVPDKPSGTSESGRADENVDDSGAGQKLEFDPYHTIDYFASQGIKLRLEDFSRDKLGQQLKSFTEWIRSMKRLPQQVAENMMDETDQHSIRRIAEHSVEEKEVLTESMAEVWVKQGNYEKARQIYRKLSLQNPSKSTYFAAKIDQLKVL